MVETPSSMIELGSAAPDFSLPNTNPAHGGQTVSLSDFSAEEPLLVVFICNHCPYVVHIIDKLVEVVNRYQPKGLATIAISSNDVETYPQDGPDKMSEFAAKHGFSFPYLFDGSQQSARDFGAECTPDLFLYDRDRHLVYRGQFDASRPGNAQPVSGEDISAAIEATLDGAEVPGTQVPSVGCNIKWRPG